ncbi:MAG: response regulator transcription factor [Clostridia bacterium]|nr:response regulator transcription factor [Clostridia bacterium]
MNRILIIEDDNDINNLIKDTFTKNGYSCTQAFSGTEGLMYAKNDTFDLIILDLMLPGMNGENVAKNIKAEKSVPIIIVSAKDSIDTKVDLLTSGADDYLTKPFEIRELLARAALQIRKTAADGSAESTLSFGDITLDKTLYSVKVGGKSASLTKQEFKILELLMTHPNKIYSKQEIYSYAWDDMYIGEDKTVNVHISNIRKKIKSVGGTAAIETVWGIGFRLK